MYIVIDNRRQRVCARRRAGNAQRIARKIGGSVMDLDAFMFSEMLSKQALLTLNSYLVCVVPDTISMEAL